MYSKKYRLTNIITENYNPIHEGLLEKICYLAYFNVGERGWFLYRTNDWFDSADRVHTSVVKNIDYTDDQVVVTTLNTKYVFELIKQEQ